MDSMKDLQDWKKDNTGRWYIISSPPESDFTFVTLYDTEVTSKAIRKSSLQYHEAINKALAEHKEKYGRKKE